MVSIDTLDFISMILTSVASGVMLTIVCILFLDLITRHWMPRSEKLERAEKPDVAVTKIEPIQESETLEEMYARKIHERKPKQPVPSEPVELASGSVRTTDGETVSISAVGKADLDKRVAQRRNYRSSEVAELLGVAPSTISTWLGKGYLQSIVASDRTRWVTAASVASLLDKLGVEPPHDAEPIVEALSEPETVEAEPIIRTPVDVKSVDVKSGTKNTTVVQSSKPSGHQWYKYYVDGGRQSYTTLREAVIAAGVRVPDGQPINWDNIGSVIRQRIKRVRL